MTEITQSSKGKAAQDAACSGNTDKTREAVSEDAGPSCPSVSPDEFLKIFLPKVLLPSDSPDEAVPVSPEQLNQIVRWVTQESGEYVNGRWKSFTKDPVEYRQPEATVFAKLCGIVNAIHNAVEQCIPELHPELQTRYYTTPSKAPATAFRYNLTRPDGYFVVDNDRSRGKANPDWIDIAVTGEFKKGSGEADIDDDVQKILWNLHHTLREDPQRRYTLGYTIENRTFRMWFASRSEIVVSDMVDWFKEPKYIIRFFFAFMYANKVEMGWDPTMELVWDGDVHVEPQYKITVRSKDEMERVFRTVSLISAVGAESIRGRGTRVWKVREVINEELSSKCYVLKDAWVDSDRPSEGEVVAQIREEAKTELSEDDQEILDSCLLTTYIAGDVMLGDKRDKKDRTIGGRRRKQLIKENKNPFPLKRISKSPDPTPPASAPVPTPSPQGPSHTLVSKLKASRSSKRGGTTKPTGDHRESAEEVAALKPLVYSSKTHYRIVFHEVCEVLHEVKSLATAVWALGQACVALRVLHKLGWVHRDISSGNLMVGIDDGKLKIADFEYAKKMTDPRREVHDIRTGTEDFMSIEVRDRSYKFITTEGISITIDNNSRSGGDVPAGTNVNNGKESALWAKAKKTAPGKRAAGQRTAPRIDLTRTVRRTWFYNPLHDFESIFWLTLNLFINKDFRCLPDLTITSDDIDEPSVYVFKEEEEDERASRIRSHWDFGRSLFAGRHDRANIFSTEGALADFLVEHPLHPALSPIASDVELMRRTLVVAYRTIEGSSADITHQSAPWVAMKLFEVLDDIVGHINSTRHLIEIQSLKRALDALPPSHEQQDANISLPQPGTSASASTSPSKKRSRGNDKEEDSGDEARKSKSPRTSVKQQSANAHVSALRRSVPAPSPRRKAKGRANRRVRAPPARRLPPIAAPFVAPAPTSQPPPPSLNPPSQPMPPTARVLRSHTRAQKPKSPSPAPVAAWTRKAATTAAGKKIKAIKETKVRATAKAATKVASKAKPKTRARKGHGL